MLKKFSHITGHIRKFKEFEQSKTRPLFLKFGGVLVCTCGSGTFIVNNKKYTISQNDMVVAFPYTVVQTEELSHDFDGVIMGVDIDLFSDLRISNRGEYFTTVRENPSMALTQKEVDKILTLQKLLSATENEKENPLRNEIGESIMKVVLYELASIYTIRQPKQQQMRTRESEIYHTFTIELFNECNRERSLQYYADKLFITPSHLSKVIKRVSGERANDFITAIVILNIKEALNDESLSIAQISEMFSFPNPSFFSQYFKRATSLTPRQFRNNLAKIEL